MRCYKCQRYGHGMDRGKKPAAVCLRCGKGGHVECDFSADPHCVNCRGDHAVSSKTCPKFLEEQAILRYKAENGGTFQQARKTVVLELHKTISTRTFASAVKSQLRTKPAALPKDGGRGGSSAPPKGKKAQKDYLAPSPQEAGETEVTSKGRAEKPKGLKAPGETFDRFAPLALDAEDTISSIWGNSSTPSSPSASASPMDSNFEELKLLLNRSQSAVVALQECRLGESQLPAPGYTLLLPQCGSPGTEAALFIRNGTCFSEISLKTGLHAAAATIGLEKINRLLSVPASQYPSFETFSG
ncbi:nucleic-acid-binding protein from mobile element jockey [Plakobranchus ocellatus]|uniref:Nucleic-acid-binding protein from mobile element jockey n=1 Tax=Plakobranchus ocellatus TaxID=259542 RepID=A0AAV4BJ77_9GAST|nr:nucleic-acid-binding protein from mobile element jockey [Plakobranchus ocellatus]